MPAASSLVLHPAHPSVELLLAGASSAAEHARECATCRAVMALATPVASAAEPERDLSALPRVDRALYAGWHELADGVGGMGRTYRARDRRLAREVAIKQVGDGAGDPALAAALRRRFEVEARLTARLQHPAIVGIYEAGQFGDGEPFYAMPLVRGASLDVEIARRPELADRLALLPHVTIACEAIAYAHGEGIVHRDLKPHNLMIGPFGETVVIDWGLARDLSAAGDDAAAAPFHDPPADGLTRAGLGTPQYMAPEQASGDGASRAMDVYALGATLYHLLAGTPPYGRAADGVRAAARAAPPRELAELAPASPPELLDIVARAMERRPAARFASVRELADELRRFQTGQLLHSRRYTLREVLARFVRRHRLAAAIAAAALIAIAAIGALAIQRVARARTRAVAGEHAAQRELRRARGIAASQLAPRATRRLEALELAVAAVAPIAGEPPPAEAVAGLTDALALGPALVVLPGHAGSGHDLALDGDRRLATLGDDGFVRLWDVRTGALIARHRVATEQPYAAIFAGDELVISGFAPALERWDPVGDRSVRLADGVAAIPWAVVTRDDVVTGSTTGTLIAWRGDRAAARVELGAGVTAMSDGPDGAIAAGLVDGSVAVWSADRRAVRWHRGHQGHLTGVGFDAVGRLISGAGDGLVRRWTDERSHTTIFAADAGVPIFGLRMSPDRRRLVIAHGRLTMLGLDDDGGVGPPIAVAGTASYRHAFAADGRLAATTGVRASILDLDGAPLLEVDAGGAAQDPRAILLASGDRMVTSDEHGQTWLWDTRVGVGAGMLPGHASELVAVAVAPGGDRVLTAGLDGRVAIVDAVNGRVTAARAGDTELAGATWLAGGGHLVWWDVDGAVELADREGRSLARWPAGAADVAVGAGATAWIATDDGRIIALERDGAREVAAGLGPASRIAVAGDRVAVGGADGSVALLDDATRAIVRPPDDGGALAALAFAPGGAHLAATWAGGRTRVYRVDDRTTAFETDGSFLTWSPDGRRVAVTTDAGGLALLDVAGVERAAFLHPGVVLAAAFSSDGATLVSAGLDGSVQVWDAATGELRLRYAAELGAATTLAVAGDLVAVGYQRGAVRTWPLSVTGARARACATLAELGRSLAHAAACR